MIADRIGFMVEDDDLLADVDDSESSDYSDSDDASSEYSNDSYFE
jgi:hypothetical protein